MRQGNGAELLGSTDPRSGSIGIIDVAPTDDREGVVAAILTQDKLGRKQILVDLPADNKAFQRPIDFDGLKNMRRKLQAQLIIVAPGGSAPAEFARQRRFPVYSSKDNFARSLGAEPLHAGQQQRRNWPFGAGRPRLEPTGNGTATSPPIVPAVPMPLPADVVEPPSPAPASANAPIEQEETHPLPPEQSAEEDEATAMPAPIPFPLPPYPAPARPYNPPSESANGEAHNAPANAAHASGFTPVPIVAPIPTVQPHSPGLNSPPRRSSGKIVALGTAGAAAGGVIAARASAGGSPPSTAPAYSGGPPARPPRRRGRVLLLALIALLLLSLLVCGGLAAAAPGTFSSLTGAVSHVIPGATGATVTITPKSQLLTASFALQAVTSSPSSANRQVQATQLTYTTPPATKTVNATGKRQTPATNATGSLTFYNGTSSVQVVNNDTVFNLSNGVQIENTVRVVIPAGNPPVEGSTTVPARAITSGSQGNIPAYTLRAVGCCGAGIVVSNTSAFHGGQDPQNYTFVQQSDVNNAASALEPQLRTQAMSGLAGQRKAGEPFVAQPACSTKSSANPAVGAKASSTTVTATATCTGEVYDLAGANKLAANLLAKKAVTNPGAGYALAGSIVTYPPQITSVDGQSGTIDLVIKTQGVWAYQFTAAAKTHLAQLIAGKSKDQAQAALLQQAGVAQASISIANNGTTLPTDPTQIDIVIQSVSGAPAPTVTPGTGTALPATPTAGPGTPQNGNG